MTNNTKMKIPIITLVQTSHNNTHPWSTSCSCQPPWHLPNDPFCLSFPVLYVVFPVTAVSEGTGSLGQEKKENPQKNEAKKYISEGNYFENRLNGWNRG